MPTAAQSRVGEEGKFDFVKAFDVDPKADATRRLLFNEPEFTMRAGLVSCCSCRVAPR